MNSQRRDPHSVSDTANPGHRYEHELNPTDPVGKGLQENEHSAAGMGSTSNEHSNLETEASSIQQREEQASWPTTVTPRDISQSGGGWRQRITGTVRRSKKKSASAVIIGILLGLLGIGGFFSFTFAPIMALNNIVLDLGDFRSAGEIRMDRIIAKKFMKTARGTTNKATIGCNGISSLMPIKCKYSTMSSRLAEKLKAGGIEVVGEKVFGNRIKPVTLNFTDSDGTKVSVPADQVKAHFSEHPSDMYKFNSALNKNFLLMRGKTMVEKAFGRYGLTDAAPELEGDHDERVKQLMNGEGAGDIDTTKFRPKENSKTDADGNPTEYVLIDEPDGKIYTVDEVKTGEAGVSRVSSAKRTPSQIEIGAARAINLVGWLDTACSFKNIIGAATVAQKVAGAAQLGQYAMRYASLIGKMQAGDISPEDARVLQEAFTSTDARKEVVNLAGTSLSDDFFEKVGIDRPEEMIPNPNFGKNALDSEPIKMSINGGTAHTSLVDKAYSLGTGQNSLLSAAAGVTNFTESVFSVPETISGGLLSCDNVQKGWVRGVGLVGGVILGLFSGGTSVAANFVGIIPIAIATYAASQAVNSLLSGSIISDVMEHAPVDRGSAFWTGMSVIMSQASLNRGMMPGDVNQIVAYQHLQNTSKQAEIALRRQQSNPLDITDPYSVAGTLAYSISEHIPSTVSGSSLTHLSSFVFGGLTSSLKPYSANAASLDENRFKQCDDEGYREVGIDADVQCNVRYVMPESSMKLDPLDVARYMEDNRYVENDTATGFPKGYTPPSPQESQESAMDFIKGMGEGLKDSFYYSEYKKYEQAADYAKFLDFCVYRTLPFGEVYEDGAKEAGIGEGWTNGANCRKEAEPFNYFRMYTFDMSVDDDLDGPIENTNNNNQSSGGGARISETQLLALIKGYNLPDPTPEGVDGWEKKLSQLSDNPKASWATQAMLAGEKSFMDKGGDLKEYLNTAWLWVENGGGAWPDPYMINCADIGEPAMHDITRHCSGSDGNGLFQVAGFQMWERQGDIIKEYQRFYSDSELVSVLEKVLQNSTNASKDIWSYSAQSNTGLVGTYLGAVSSGSATIDNIAPKGGNIKTDSKTQFLTTMLGKDPNMATALNSYAVSDSDLIAQLKKDCLYDSCKYYGASFKQLLSNMVYALWKFDSLQGSAGRAGANAGTGIAAIFEGGSIPGISQEFGPTEFAQRPENYDMYDYQLEYGIPASQFGHTGIDYGLDIGTKLYSPVSGTVVTAGGTPYFRSTDRLDSDGISLPRTGELKIKLSNGDEVILGHMQRIDVEVGKPVSVGQYVGLSGTENSGHVHLEYRIPDESTIQKMRIVNPKEYL